MSGVEPLAPGPTALDARRTGRSTLFALAATALDKGGAMVMLLLIARLLGAEDFGRYAALMAWLALFQVAAEFGQEPVLVRLLAQERSEEVAPLVQGALAMRIVCAAAVGALLVSAGGAVLPAVGRVPLVLAAAGLMAGYGLALRALFRTAQRLEWLCVTALAGLGAFAGVLLVARAFGLGVAGAVGAWAAGQLAASLAAVRLAAVLVAPWPRWRGRVTALLARSGWALALNGFLLTVTLRVGQLIVLRAEGPAAVGYLAAGSRLAEAFALIPESLMLVLLPVLSATDRDARESQRMISAQAVRYLALLALAVIVAVSIAAPTLLRALFGPAYVAGAPALRILAWLALLAASGSVFTNLLIARRLERLLLVLNAAGSVLTLALSLVLVPCAGFVGAAAATLIASVAAQAILLVVPATRSEVAACLRPLVWPVFLAAALTLGAAAVPGSRPAVAAVALVAFAAGILVTRTVGPDDWVLLRRVLQRT